MTLHFHRFLVISFLAIASWACTPPSKDPSPDTSISTPTTTGTGTSTTTGPVTSSSLVKRTIRNLPADPSETTNSGGQPTVGAQYTLFSFKDSSIVSNKDSASLKWDIGFNASTIIINGGTSGPGLAAAQVVVGLYDDLTQAPENGYKVDNKAASPPWAIPTGSGNGWYNYNSTSHILSPIPGRVLVFRTADGEHYAKVQIISYYKDYPISPTSDDIARYYTFRYAYQTNKTRSLVE